MKIKENYDWIVIGDHPAALLSAALVARLGLTVLVLPFSPGFRAMTTGFGQCLDPEPNFLMGLGEYLEKPGLVAKCLRAVGATNADLEPVQRECVISQVVTPTSRIVVSHDNESLLREFRRELAEKAGLVSALARSEEALLAYWSGLPERLSSSSDGKKKKGPARFEKRLLQKLKRGASSSGEAGGKVWLSPRGRTSELDHGEFWAGLWHVLSGTGSDDPLRSQLLQNLAVSRTAAGFRGGMGAYRDLLLKLAQRLGAQVPVGVECKQLFVEDGRFKGVQVSESGGVVNGKAGILGCSLGHIRDHVAHAGSSWIHRLKAAPKPVGWKFSVALTVHDEAIPAGMGPRLVWSEKGAPALEVEVANPVDYGLIQPDHRIVFARTLMPFVHESLSVSSQRILAARMLRKLAELIPFVEYHITRVYPDFRVAADAGSDFELEELSDVYGFASTDMIPENLRCFADEGVGYDSGIGGLFQATGESYPSLGSLGPTVAALEATAWIAQRSGLVGPLG